LAETSKYFLGMLSSLTLEWRFGENQQPDNSISRCSPGKWHLVFGLHMLTSRKSFSADSQVTPVKIIRM